MMLCSPIYFKQVGLWCQLVSSNDLYFLTRGESPSPGDCTASNRQAQAGKTLTEESLGRELVSLRVPCLLLAEHLRCQGLTEQCLQSPLPSRRAPVPP